MTVDDFEADELTSEINALRRERFDAQQCNDAALVAAIDAELAALEARVGAAFDE